MVDTRQAFEGRHPSQVRALTNLALLSGAKALPRREKPGLPVKTENSR
jgi:hypothetical protein